MNIVSKVVARQCIRSVDAMISNNILTKLAARRRRMPQLDVNADLPSQRRTGDPRLDLAIIERRWTV